jgi:hypothetical protein
MFSDTAAGRGARARASERASDRLPSQRPRCSLLQKNSCLNMTLNEAEEDGLQVFLYEGVEYRKDPDDVYQRPFLDGIHVGNAASGLLCVDNGRRKADLIPHGSNLHTHAFFFIAPVVVPQCVSKGGLYPPLTQIRPVRSSSRLEVDA